MHEFVMPLGDTSTEFAIQYQRNLDDFTRGYIDAIFATECRAGNPELEDATINDFSGEAWSRILTDCADFQGLNGELLDEAYDHETTPYDAECAGIDYWLTRNGHGAGFWDRGLGAVGDRLSNACRWQELDLYRGDDGKLYFA